MNYSTADVIAELKDKGYKLVSDNFDVTKMPENGGKYEVHFIRTTKPTDPSKPGTREQTVTISYVDDTTGTEHTDLSSYNKTITAKPGADLNYSTADVIAELKDKGYKLVSDNFDVTKMPENGGKYEVHFIRTTKPTNPSIPGDNNPGDHTPGGNTPDNTPENKPDDKPGKPEEKPDKPENQPNKPEEKPSQPEQPGKPAQPGQPAEPTAKPAAQNKLPQTGNKDNRSALAAGFIGLAGLLALLGLRKRKHN